MTERPDLGVKRRCLSCNAPFFDMNRDPITCVKCGAVFTVIELPRRHPPGRPKRFGPIPAPMAPVEQAEAAESPAADEADADDAQDQLLDPEVDAEPEAAEEAATAERND